MIIRLYETHRQRGTAVLEGGFAIACAYETNLLEENERELQVMGGNTISQYFAPYQIRTIRLIPA